MNYYNTYDFTNNKLNMINKKNVYFLKEIDGHDLFDAVNKSKKDY